MGFHDVTWSYSLGRPLAETAVLAALCHRTDDATHETYVGQQTIAAMIGSSPEKVLRALKALEAAGIITRTRRHGAGGYRTSDRTRVNVDTYMTNRLQGESPTGQISYQENRRDLPDFSSRPNPQKVTAIGQPVDQPEGQPDLLVEAFDRSWSSWPKKVKRSQSLQAFTKAAKSRSVDELTADIIRFGTAYAATTQRQFVPALVVWLNGERWTDDLPQPPVPSDAEWQRMLDTKPTPQRKRFVAYPDDETTDDGGTGAACAAGVHKWLPNGTCNHCPAKRPSEHAS